MAKGDADDMLVRIKRNLPTGWFGPEGSYPILEALLAGAAWALALVYSLYAFAKLQTRIASATGAWLELTSYDFFGDMLKRFNGEKDSTYSRRIRLEVFRERNTRTGIDRAIFDLTGTHPDIYEAWRPGDCGGYGMPSMAYGIAGLYGSKTAPFEVIISTPELTNYGIPNRAGYGVSFIGYGSPPWGYADDADLVGSGPTFQDLLAALDRVRTAAVTYYVRLTQLGDPNP